MTISDGICGRCNKPTLIIKTGQTLVLKGNKKVITMINCEACSALHMLKVDRNKMKQNQVTELEQEEQEIESYHEDDCQHEYEFLETLPSDSESYIPKLYVCILCNRDKVVKHYFGVRD